MADGRGQERKNSVKEERETYVRSINENRDGRLAEPGLYPNVPITGASDLESAGFICTLADG